MSVLPEMIHSASELRPHSHDVAYFQIESAISGYVAQLLCRYVQPDNSRFALSSEASRLRLQRVLEVVYAMHSTQCDVETAMRLLPDSAGFMARTASASGTSQAS